MNDSFVKKRQFHKITKNEEDRCIIPYLVEFFLNLLPSTKKLNIFN